MALTGVNFSMYTGDAEYLPVPNTNSDGTVLNLTGATVKWVVQDNEFSLNYRIYKDTVNGGITITDPTTGIYTINLISNDTKNLPPGNYYHEARVIDASGNPSTLMTGTLTLIQNAKSM